ncbi:MAG: cytochrome c [Gemmatimonadales bacterium]|nr:cytochrome c [Gemmatimonadales bacterium]
MGRLLFFLVDVVAIFALLMLLGRLLVARSRVPQPGDSAAETVALGAVGWLLRLSGWLVLLLVSAAAVTYMLSERTLRRRLDIPLPALAVPSDSAALARGAHLVPLLGCPGCHGSDLGGKVFFEERGVARLVAPNLTRGPGGRGADYSDMELARALREGVRRNGQPLFAMPTAEFHSLSDADLGAVIAHVRRVPPVASIVPPTRIWWLGRLGIATGRYPVSRDFLPDTAPRPVATPSGATVEHGRYLAHAICTECHLATGEVERVARGEPPHMDVLAAYDAAGLRRVVSHGVAQDGRTLRPMMGGGRFAGLTDEELAALQVYFRSRLAGAAPAP